jgi:molecular chaperone GrpE (heat shock protein)
MTKFDILNALLHFLFFFMGAGIGSFLNVVIYRMPRGMSVNEPRRSFCPSCKNQIPMWLNIPIVSWIMLRGKCAKCGCSISPRYLGVELLTGLLFYGIFWKLGGDWATFKEWGPHMLCLWLFTSLLVAGSFIDIEHYILPPEITFGGTAAGLICATLVPSLMGEESHIRGGLISAASGAVGLGGLWLVVQLGKLAFGRVKRALKNRRPGASPSRMTKSWKDLAYRSQAELDNFRKRAAREAQEARAYANADLLRSLLPIMDNFEMGLEAAKAESEKSMIYMGMSMVQRQIQDFLREQGVQEIDTLGKTFDVHVHEAVAPEASATVPEGTIIRATRRGFRMKERLLRPASVIVSSGPPSSESAATPTT